MDGVLRAAAEADDFTGDWVNEGIDARWAINGDPRRDFNFTVALNWLAGDGEAVSCVNSVPVFLIAQIDSSRPVELDGSGAMDVLGCLLAGVVVEPRHLLEQLNLCLFGNRQSTTGAEASASDSE